MSADTSQDCKQSKILIIDDDESCRKPLTQTLLLEGYTNVLSAASGQQALSLLRLEPDIKLILCDITMPGLTGYNVIDEVRRRYHKIKFVFVTAKATQIDQMVGLKMGADAYLTKPYRMDDLIKVVEDLLKPNPKTN